jgi:hypothetical protein
MERRWRWSNTSRRIRWITSMPTRVEIRSSNTVTATRATTLNASQKT